MREKIENVVKLGRKRDRQRRDAGCYIMTNKGKRGVFSLAHNTLPDETNVQMEMYSHKMPLLGKTKGNFRSLPFIPPLSAHAKEKNPKHILTYVEG